uniref:D-xylose 1-dehydrogenase (NADP(+), D-xylono-1,5-lactone-forming) n=1 Tax=Mycena chlorophos TaxID=658473 RepID=A0ABQ0M0B9_MYCCL|nr:NAD(P)-binding protein [Mycena chlorophos]
MFALLSRIYHISNPPHATASPETKPLNFGSLGAAKITPGALVKPAQSHPEVVLYAVAARDAQRAEEFAKEHGFQKSYGGPTGYQDMLDDPALDVVYNPLPNGLHFEWTMKALDAGKHVLLEKPATNTAAEAAAIYALASRKNLVVLEAFHYRFHPAIQRVKTILDSGELGPIKTVKAALTAPEGTAPEGDIRWSYELGGGSTMDPGCYTLNVLRYLAGCNPVDVLTAKAVPYSTKPEHKQVDKMFWATLAMERESVGEIHSNLDEKKLWGIIPRIPKLSAIVECANGKVEIFNFLIPHFYHSITVSPAGKSRRVERAYSFKGIAKGEDWWTTYRYQLEAFVDKVQGRVPQTWLEADDTIANMKWVEAIYAKDGFGSRPASKYEPKQKMKRGVSVMRASGVIRLIAAGFGLTFMESYHSGPSSRNSAAAASLWLVIIRQTWHLSSAANIATRTQMSPRTQALLLFLSIVVATATRTPQTPCSQIQAEISPHSSVFFPGTAGFAADIAHFALSAEQNSTCSVEPATTEDLGTILSIVGKTRTPFAVKGGGHNLNPGFSSTAGVEISMTRFNKLVFVAASQTVEVGSGLIWDDVYAGLAPFNVSVVGGRATGIGISGYLLGGGYSYQTNEYGLAVDNVVSIELVLPDGQVQVVSQTSNPDLFFAVRGGGNNFGVATTFTLKTHAQGMVWGGSLTYNGSEMEAVTQALLHYTTSNTDPKTGLQCTYASLQGQQIVMVNIYYNAPTPAAGVFNKFLDIPAISSDVGTRSYYSLILSADTNLTAGFRGVYNTISHTAVTAGLTSAMINETMFYGSLLAAHTLVLNGYVIEPFIPAAYQKGRGAAYPPDNARSENIHPMNIYYAWVDPAADELMVNISRATANRLASVATQENILATVKYPNYALFGTPLEELYGENIQRLHEIALKIDSEGTMGLAGGWKL